jgi:hypothetical protein
MTVNEARLLRTDGFALQADVELSGRHLVVMDSFSPAGGTSQPGRIFDVQIGCFEIQAPSWEAFFDGNPENRKDLVHLDGWDYLGFGEVVAVNPMVIDFGIAKLRGGFATHDERCIGHFVAGRVKRLELAGRPEFPIGAVGG